MEDKGTQINKEAWAKPGVKKLKLLKGIFNIAKGAVTGNWVSVPMDAADAIEAINLGEGAGKMGWILISRSLTDAVLNLIIENNLDFTRESIVVDQLDKDLNEVLENEEFFIGLDFFKSPGKLPFIDRAKPIFSDFLQLCGFDEADSKNMVNRLGSYFVFSLVNEWRRNYSYYQVLEKHLKTPFDEAAKRENEWYLYSRWLSKQVDEPVFSESFSLRQVYIPIRAYYKIKQEGKESDRVFTERGTETEYKRVVTDLEDELMRWYNKADKNDAIRIIRGGPGYGKSSFLKIFSEKLAGKGERVLLIPLHRLEVKEDLIDAVRNFTKYDKFFSGDPFEEERLLIIFDGLDEISMQGKVLAEVASQFVREVDRKVNNLNNRETRLMVIISGRDVVVQQNEAEFRKDRQVLRLLPYYLKEKDTKDLTDSKKMLKTDQRHIWWQNYGKLKGQNYKGLPDKLKSDDLDELTAQPLLNYLVALSYERDNIDFSAGTNLNEIYNDLLEAVYDRKYAECRKHPTVERFPYLQFTRILEEIAAATWHGDGRKTTVKEIESHFKEGGLKKLLDDFIKEAEKGVVSLLAAFYFRKAGHDISGTETFEFTHKSFGEYLACKRIVNKIKQIHKKIRENEENYEEGWNIKICLTEWAKLFGSKDIDQDLVRFIQNEIKLEFEENPDNVKAWQQTIIKLINHVLKNGFPMEKLDPRPSYYIENLQAINAEKALLIILGTLSSFTKVVSDIDWPERTSFGEWLSRLAGQRTGGNVLLYRFLNHLNLETVVLHIKDLYKINLSWSNLNGAELVLANLIKANLRGANLQKADLLRADLQRANLEGADLQRANLEGADLREADLQRANLEGADFSRASIDEANFSGVRNLDKAIGLNLKKKK